MHAERDYLTRFTFPAIRERLLPYGVELYEIDLRWGITEEEAQNDRVLSLCLEQVDECRPFFLAVLGNRYGWIPDQIPPEVRERFPFVGQFPGASVTELEIRHGILNNPLSRHALVLERSGETLDAIPTSIRTRDFLESDPGCQSPLDQLKAELKSEGFPVKTYSARWNSRSFDRVNRCRGKLDGLENFGQIVEAWLWEAIRAELQLPASPEDVEPLQAENRMHERFLELRSRVFVGRDTLFNQLEDFVREENDCPCLLTGENGLGKSAVLAWLIRHLREREPHVVVIGHFVGASPYSTSLESMLKRLTEELQQKFEIPLPEAKTTDAVLTNFNTALGSIPQTARVVLVIDGLNQLDADRRAETLTWLPERLPKNVRIVCSVAHGTSQKSRILSAFENRRHVKILIHPLSDEECRALVRAVPKLVAKTLSEDQVALLLANPATRNPLYLMVALTELRGYGSFEYLTRMIQRLPQGDDPLRLLFEQMFQRLENEFGQALVKRTLSLLVCARKGLSGSELCDLTLDLGDAGDVYPLMRQLEPYLFRRDGRYDFFHASIRRAAERYFLQWEEDEDQGAPFRRWDLSRERPAADPSEPEFETRDCLIAYWSKDRLTPRALEELPWQLAQLRDWQGLLDLLGDVNYFPKAWLASPLDTRQLWGLLKRHAGFSPVEAYQAVMRDPQQYEIEQIWGPASFLSAISDFDSAGGLWDHLIKRVRGANDSMRLQGFLGQRASDLLQLNKLSAAMEMFQEQEQICREIDHPFGIVASLQSQGDVYKLRLNFEEALKRYREAEAILRRQEDAYNLADCLGRLADLQIARRSYRSAMDTLEEQTEISRRFNDPLLLQYGLQLQTELLHGQGDFLNSLRLLREREELCRRYNLVPELVKVLFSQTDIRLDLGEVDTAWEIFQEADRLVQTLDRVLSANCSHSMSRLWERFGQPEKALMCLKQSLEILQQSDSPLFCVALLIRKAEILESQGDFEAAIKLHEESEELLRQAQSETGIAACLGYQARIHRTRGDHDLALSLYQRQEQLCQRVEIHFEYLCSLQGQSEILADRGEFEQAIRLLMKQENHCRRHEDPVGLADALANQALLRFRNGQSCLALELLEKQELLCYERNNLSALQRGLGVKIRILRHQGEIDAAMMLAKKREDICRQLQDIEGLQESLAFQANTLFDQEDFRNAFPLFEELESIFRRNHLNENLRFCLGRKARILTWRGDIDLAAQTLREQERLCRESKDFDSLQWNLGVQAQFACDQGHPGEAMRFLQEQEAICRSLGKPLDLARCLNRKARVFYVQGNVAAALNALKDQEDHCRQSQDLRGLYESLEGQARICLDQGQQVQAQPFYKEQEWICRHLNDGMGLAKSLGNQGAILQLQGRPDEALALFREQESLCRHVNDSRGLAISLVNQGVLLAMDLGKPEEGFALAQGALALAEHHGFESLIVEIRAEIERMENS